MNKWDVLKDVPPRLEVSAVAKRTKKATTKTRRQKSAANTKAPLAPRPGKRALRGKLGRISRNHKRRSVWFQARAAWPLREARVGKLVSERARVEKEFCAGAGLNAVGKCRADERGRAHHVSGL